MREFNKVDAKYWMSLMTKKIIGLGTEAVLLSIYLHTNHHTHSFGVYHLPLQYMAHDTGIDNDQVREHLESLCKIGFCDYDFDHEYIWVKEFALVQSNGALKEGDSRIVQAHKYFKELPELSFLYEYYRKHKNDFHLSEHLATAITPCQTPVDAPLTGPRRTETETETQTQTETQTETNTDTKTEGETDNIVALPRQIFSGPPEKLAFDPYKSSMDQQNANIDKRRSKLFQAALKHFYDRNQRIDGVSRGLKPPTT